MINTQKSENFSMVKIYNDLLNRSVLAPDTLAVAYAMINNGRKGDAIEHVRRIAMDEGQSVAVRLQALSILEGAQ